MNEIKKSESFDPTESCDNKPSESIRKHTLTLETLLKEIYSNHKETIKLCREEQKEKFTKIVSLKNKMFERGKEIQKECNILKKENQDLKEALSSRTDVPCKTCDHLRRSFDSLEEAYKRSLNEKDKMIKYLEAQLNGQQHSFNSNPDSVSPKSSPDQQKNNRLKLKPLKKRVIYKESAEQHPIQVLPSNINSNSKLSSTASLLNVPETCLPDTCAVDATTSEKATELNDELTVVPDTLALFNFWDSDGETDQNLSKIPEEVIEKSLVLESPCNKTDASSTTISVGATHSKPPKNLSVQNEIPSNPKTLSSDKNISTHSKNGNPALPLQQSSMKMDDSDKNMKTYKIEQFGLEGHLQSPTKSPLRKKRKQLTNEISKCDLSQTNKDRDTKDKADGKKETVLPLQSLPDNGQVIERHLFKGKKFNRRCRSKENHEKNCEIDFDQTLPPENWGNETLINDTEVNNTEKITTCSNGDNRIRHTCQSPISENVAVSPNKTDQQTNLINGSLAPSMHMTQFLAENEFSEDQRNRNDDLSKNLKNKTTTELVEIESSSQTFPSRSYKFAAGKSPNFKEAVNDGAAEPTNETLCDSFDNVPFKEEKIAYAYHSVVRKKDERRKLNGYTCRECVEYYQAKGLSEDEIRLQVRDCSRHRAKYKAPSTPEHFWSVDFPDTMECEKRGYFIRDESKPPAQLRRRKRLHPLKTHEEDKNLKTETDEQIGMTQMLEYLSAEED